MYTNTFFIISCRGIKVIFFHCSCQNQHQYKKEIFHLRFFSLVFHLLKTYFAFYHIIFHKWIGMSECEWLTPEIAQLRKARGTTENVIVALMKWYQVKKPKLYGKLQCIKTTLDNFSQKDTVNVTQQMILMSYTNQDNCRWNWYWYCLIKTIQQSWGIKWAYVRHKDTQIPGYGSKQYSAPPTCGKCF